MSTEDTLRKQLWAAFESRAVLYEILLDVLKEEHDHEQAIAILRKVLHRWGAEVAGPGLRKFAPADIAGLAQHLCASSADEGKMFCPKILRADDCSADVKFTTCSFKATWERRGLGPEHIALLCDLTSEFDRGKLAAAGFDIVADGWKPGDSGCCTLKIAKCSANTATSTRAFR